MFIIRRFCFVFVFAYRTYKYYAIFIYPRIPTCKGVIDIGRIIELLVYGINLRLISTMSK